MQKLRLVLGFLAIAMIIGNILTLNFNDLSWQLNKSNYILMIAMVCVAVSSFLSFYQEKKRLRSQ